MAMKRSAIIAVLARIPACSGTSDAADTGSSAVSPAGEARSLEAQHGTNTVLGEPIQIGDAVIVIDDLEVWGDHI
jgi:hypothetical protein